VTVAIFVVGGGQQNISMSVRGISDSADGVSFNPVETYFIPIGFEDVTDEQLSYSTFSLYTTICDGIVGEIKYRSMSDQERTAARESYRQARLAEIEASNDSVL